MYPGNWKRQEQTTDKAGSTTRYDLQPNCFFFFMFKIINDVKKVDDLKCNKKVLHVKFETISFYKRKEQQNRHILKMFRHRIIY